MTVAIDCDVQFDAYQCIMVHNLAGLRIVFNIVAFVRSSFHADHDINRFLSAVRTTVSETNTYRWQECELVPATIGVSTD